MPRENERPQDKPDPLEDEIDEALEETFPASDPPPWTLGTDHRSPTPRKPEQQKKNP